VGYAEALADHLGLERFGLMGDLGGHWPEALDWLRAGA
jgi:hypothetical protein